MPEPIDSNEPQTDPVVASPVEPDPADGETVAPAAAPEADAGDATAVEQPPANTAPPAAAADDELGLPEGVISRTLVVPLSLDDVPGYTPGDCMVRLDTQAQIGLRRLHAGLATIEGRDLDHSTVICWLLGRLAE